AQGQRQERHADHSSLNDGPIGRARVWVLTGCALWLLVHVAIPLHYYYLGDDLYDERFAWRMFSAVRLQRCEVVVTELARGSVRAVPLIQILPAPWTA